VWCRDRVQIVDIRIGFVVYDLNHFIGNFICSLFVSGDNNINVLSLLSGQVFELYMVCCFDYFIFFSVNANLQSSGLITVIGFLTKLIQSLLQNIGTPIR
jgi:hypothetical protein